MTFRTKGLNLARETLLTSDIYDGAIDRVVELVQEVTEQVLL